MPINNIHAREMSVIPAQLQYEGYRLTTACGGTPLLVAPNCVDVAPFAQMARPATTTARLVAATIFVALGCRFDVLGYAPGGFMYPVL